MALPPCWGPVSTLSHKYVPFFLWSGFKNTFHGVTCRQAWRVLDANCSGCVCSRATRVPRVLAYWVQRGEHVILVGCRRAQERTRWTSSDRASPTDLWGFHFHFVSQRGQWSRYTHCFVNFAVNKSQQLLPRFLKGKIVHLSNTCMLTVFDTGTLPCSTADLLSIAMSLS